MQRLASFARVYSVLAIVLCASLVACEESGHGPVGCKPGVPAGPATCIDTSPVPTVKDALPSDVGPSPLRRLSNQEYLNALHDLFPDQTPVLPTLPSDADVGGFDNAAEGQTPSDVRIARFEAIAGLYAAGATRDAAAVQDLVGCDFSTAELADTCGRSFVQTLGRRLFRRPLELVEQDRLAVRFARWTQAIDFEAAVQLTLSAMLQSPQFLYRPEVVSDDATVGWLVEVEPYAMASRLSFLLWASIPDETLLDAAAHGQLQTVEQLRAQAERMLQDARSTRVYWDFHRQWLGLDRVLDDEHMVRTAEVDPAWSIARQQSVHRESQLFVENVLQAGGSLRDLLLSRRAWLNQDLMALYGLPSAANTAADDYAEVMLPPAQRAGILTRAAFLAGFSHRGATSPPIRANALGLRMLCRSPTPPPPGIDTTPPGPDVDAGVQTNRMLFEARTAPAACKGCHLGLNGTGFGFEQFNAAGIYSLTDHGLPVDASGHLYGTDVDRDFQGVAELSEALSVSRDVHRCASQQWLRYALGRAPVDGETKLIDTLTGELMQDGSSVHDLLLSIVSSASFRYQLVEGT